jgi:hypothetical protein
VEVTIVKTGERNNRAIVVLEDGSVLRFAVPDYGGRLPHDLVHYAVESTLALDWGFWGLLSRGAQFEAVRAAGARDRRRLSRMTDPLVAAHLDDLLAAEMLVDGLYDLWGRGGNERERITEAFDRAGWVPPVDLDDEEVLARIRKNIADLTAAWGEVGVGDSLAVTWPAPAGGDAIPSG